MGNLWDEQLCGDGKGRGGGLSRGEHWGRGGRVPFLFRGAVGALERAGDCCDARCPEFGIYPEVPGALPRDLKPLVTPSGGLPEAWGNGEMQGGGNREHVGRSGRNLGKTLIPGHTVPSGPLAGTYAWHVH